MVKRTVSFRPVFFNHPTVEVQRSVNMLHISGINTKKLKVSPRSNRGLNQSLFVLPSCLFKNDSILAFCFHSWCGPVCLQCLLNAALCPCEGFWVALCLKCAKQINLPKLAHWSDTKRWSYNAAARRSVRRSSRSRLVLVEDLTSVSPCAAVSKACFLVVIKLN